MVSSSDFEVIIVLVNVSPSCSVKFAEAGISFAGRIDGEKVSVGCWKNCGV